MKRPMLSIHPVCVILKVQVLRKHSQLGNTEWIADKNGNKISIKKFN